jgi:hypothetical protein
MRPHKCRDTVKWMGWRPGFILAGHTSLPCRTNPEVGRDHCVSQVVLSASPFGK